MANPIRPCKIEIRYRYLDSGSYNDAHTSAPFQEKSWPARTYSNLLRIIGPRSCRPERSSWPTSGRRGAGRVVALAPVIDRVADQFAGQVKVGKVNVDENGDLAVKYDVSTIPRVLMFKGGDQPIWTRVGTMSDAELAKEIQARV